MNKMDSIFFIGILIGIISRLLMLNLDNKQYPTHPNVLLSQIVLAFVSSSLGALLVPALIQRSYTSITFLSNLKLLHFYLWQQNNLDK